MNENELKPTYLSLFSGCGGFDLGFEDEDYHSLGAIDNDPAVLEVYRANLKGQTFLHDLSTHDLPVDYPYNQIDVLVTGSPCQGFSTAGLRKVDDPRNSLLLVGGEIARLLNPKVVVCENVMGSLSGAHKIYWSKLTERLKRYGYNLDFIECSATDFGLAQLRKRVFLIAWKGKKIRELKLETSSKQTLREVLTGVENKPNQEHFIPITDPKVMELVKHIRSGQKLCDVRGGGSAVHTWNIPSVFGDVSEEEKVILNLVKILRRKIRRRSYGDADPVLFADIQAYCDFSISTKLDSLIDKGYLRTVGEFFDLKNTYNGLYKRLEWNKSSMTDTRFGNPRYFLHPSEDRGFTVREAARIQGFPDSFIFSGSIDRQFKMIGNAVPPPLAGKIARFIKNNLL